MRRISSLILAVALSLAPATAFAQAVDIVGEAKNIIADLSEIGNRPIAVLTRVDNDPGQFWYKAMQALCDATGDNWCEDQVRFLTDTTNQLGWAKTFTYKGDNGATKTVCALLPPRRGINPGYVANGLSSGGVYSAYDLATSVETEAYLILLHAASCLNNDGGDRETRRADVFATLALTLIQGDSDFVGAYDVTPSRLFNKLRSSSATRWGTNVGERLLLDLWKDEAAVSLNKAGCHVTVTASDNLNTDYITRTRNGDAGSCSDSENRNGQLTDENLWSWTSGSYGVNLPPAPYSAFKMFDNIPAGVSYAWSTADQLSR